MILDLPKWHDRLVAHRDVAIDLIGLLLAAAIGSRLGWPTYPPYLAALGVVILLLPSRPRGTPVKVLLKRIPLLLLVGTGTGALLVFLWDLPMEAWRILVLWIAASLLIRIGQALWLIRARWLPPLQRLSRRWTASGADDALAVALLIAAIGLALDQLNPELTLAPVAWVVAAALWWAIDRWPRGRWHAAPSVKGAAARLAVRFVIWCSLLVPLLHFSGTALDRSAVALVVCCAVLITAFAAGRRLSEGAGAETARRLIALGVAIFLVAPLVLPAPLGGDDAIWYALTLADVLAQVREGIFPVFVGQSSFQFNGSIFPVRVAPLYHHLGILVDGLTLHSLPFAAVQNLTLIVIALAAAWISYSCLARLLPTRRWHALGFALLYFLCPGVISILYNGELYMTWTTVPWLPVVLLASIQTFRQPGPRPLALLVLSLGLLWWGHSPIALWMTAIAAVLQLVRLVQRWREPGTVVLAALAAVVFLLLVAYPVTSVLFVTPEGVGDNRSYAVARAEVIARFVRESFPAAFLAVSPTGRTLSDFQLGWAWWVGFGVVVATAARVRQTELRLLALAAGALLFLMIPVPGVNDALWNLVPGLIRNPTGNWAMTRLYLLGSALLAFASVLAAQAWWLRDDRRRFIGAAVLTLGVCWSGLEAAKFVRGSWQIHRALALQAPALLPENIFLTRYSYLVFNHYPPYFSHGVVEPHLEQRLLRPDTFEPMVENAEAVAADPELGQVVETGLVHGRAEDNGWLLDPTFTLHPGQRYLLELHPTRPDATGVLVLKGGGLQRVYGLPLHGEARAFGSGPDSSPYLPIWTSGAEPVEVDLQFIAQGDFAAADFTVFARYRLLRYDPARLPVAVTSWLPYEATVRAPEPAWLETPRLFQRDYAATVDGQAVEIERSPAGLVMFPVPAGGSTVRLEYRAPWALRGTYALSAGSFLLLGIVLLRSGRASGRRLPPPPGVTSAP